MSLLRIERAVPLEGFRLRLWLSDGSLIERDVGHVMVGPIFEPIRRDPERFAEVRAEGGTVVWPNGADLCPDVVIWGGPPPQEESAPAGTLSDSRQERP